MAWRAVVAGPAAELHPLDGVENGAMRVFTIAPAEGYEWVLPLDDEDFEVLLRFDGTPRRPTWTPMPMRLVTSDEGVALKRSDFPWLGSHVLIMRPRAIECLRSLLDAHGELLPLQCGNESLQVLNVRSMIEALNLDTSAVVRVSSGRLMTIRKHVFFPERIADAQLFKLPQISRGSIYVSDAFVHAVTSSDLRGLSFKLVWDSAPAQSHTI
jgi:Immunity protein family (Imm11)